MASSIALTVDPDPLINAAESGLDFEFRAGVRNRPRRIIYTDEASSSDLENPVRWKDEALVCVKYVDDCLAIEKLNYAGTTKIHDSGNDYARVRAIKCQDHFRTVEYNASRRGMIINQKKN